MKLYLKVIGVVPVILAFLKLFLQLKLFRRWLLVLVLRLLRWIDVYMQTIAKSKKQYHNT